MSMEVTSPAQTRRGMSIIAVGGFASIAAGAVHAAAAGIHAEHPQLARIFVIVAALQIGVGLWAAIRPARPASLAVVAVNGAAVVGWMVTRLSGISWIDGLEVREAPQFSDTACAVLAVVAVVAAYTGAILPADQRRRSGLSAPSILIGVLAVWTMFATSTHVHSHDATSHVHATTAADAAGAAEGAGANDAAAAAATDAAAPTHTHDSAAAPAAAAPSDTPVVTTAALGWPRPWDPSKPIDLSGVEGVTAAEQLRAMKLVQDTLRDLPKYSDPAAAIADGYTSIGDAGTGSEHFIKASLIEDNDLLDPAAPESIVYDVKNGQRTLAGAMYIASARPADDPTLTGFAGPLMTWHKHDNLCWALDANGAAKVVGIIDANGNCARGVRAGGENPMVHVWVKPHPCGVFAALEGIGAGTAAVPEAQRVDTCSAAHHHAGG
jgi:hypothetical protein